MKTILIATDFSPAANNATAYGMQLAASFNAHVTLFHACIPVPMPTMQAPITISQEEIERSLQRQLIDEASLLSAKYNARVSTSCKTGSAAQTIREAVEENQVSLVIVGMKTRGKLLRKLFGSTVTALISRMNVPIVVVPEKIRFTPIVNIALATESDLAPGADGHILDALREIGEQFHSKLYLVRVATNKFQTAYEVKNRPIRLTRSTQTLHPAYECIEGKDVPMALANFAKAYDINLLAMLPHQHTALEEYFTKSATRAMAFETPTPLLVLPKSQIGLR